MNSFKSFYGRSWRIFISRFKKYRRYFSLAEHIDFQLSQSLKQTASTGEVYIFKWFNQMQINRFGCLLFWELQFEEGRGLVLFLNYKKSSNLSLKETKWSIRNWFLVTNCFNKAAPNLYSRSLFHDFFSIGSSKLH